MIYYLTALINGFFNSVNRMTNVRAGKLFGTANGALINYVEATVLSLLLMLVRQGEAARRMLPTAPIVSARSFAERAWPYMLAWSDLGLNGKERMTVDSLARAEVRRFADDDTSDRMRGEMMGLLGELLGISPEQMEELRSE